MSFEEVELGAIALTGDAGLVDGPFGSNLPASDYVEDGVPVIRGSNLSKGECRFKGDDFVFVSEATAGRLARSICLPSDIIFTKKGTLGQVGIVPRKPYDKYLLSSNQMRLRVDETTANADFVYYALSTKESILRIVREAEHTGVPKINLAYIRRFQIPFPPRAVQEQICEIARALDDRIDLLRETNATLEAIAQALFKSWFVDFDPVRAKAEGRDPEGVPPEVAALFPSEFEDSELGEIPKGWRVGAFADITDVVGGATPSTKEPAYWEDGQHCWATPKDLSGMDTPVLLDTERKITDAGLAKISSGLLPVGTVLMSSRAPIGYLAIAEEPVAVNQGFIAMKPKVGISNLFLLNLLRMQMDEIKTHANGSTFMEISKAAFRPLKVVVPPTPVIQAFDDVVRSLYERMVGNVRQIANLTELRDTLLPRLMSGKLRVPQAGVLQ